MSKDFVKASEIRATLNTPGWRWIEETLERIVRRMETDALAIEDESRIVAAQREARVARKILTDFRSKVQIAGSPEKEPDSDDILVAM